MLKTQAPGPINIPHDTLPCLDLRQVIHTLIRRHFRGIAKQVDRVLDDRDPEPLHQMRVSIRHLRATLKLFEPIVVIPKRGKPKALRQLGRSLGAVRNLDVVQQSLIQDYYPQLPEAEQGQLEKVLAELKTDRKVAFRSAKRCLKSLDFEPIYRRWLKHPQYENNLAALSPTLFLPSLLNPAIAQFLLHSGWSISSNQYQLPQQTPLHDLRKVCKQVRYQLEDVQALYGEDMKTWITELKQIQDCLGMLQDLQVLQELIQTKLASTIDLVTFDRLLQHQRQETLQTWENLRSVYLDPDLKNQRYQLIFQLKPTE